MKICAGLLVVVPLLLVGCGSSEVDEKSTTAELVTPTPLGAATPSGTVAPTPITTSSLVPVVTATTAAVANIELGKSFTARLANSPNYSEAEKSYINDILQAFGLLDSAINRIRDGGDANTSFDEATRAKAMFSRWSAGPERLGSAHPQFVKGVDSILAGVIKWKEKSTFYSEEGAKLFAEGNQSIQSGLDMMNLSVKDSPLKIEENLYLNKLKTISDAIQVQINKTELGNPVNPATMGSTMEEVKRLADEARNTSTPPRFAAMHSKFVQGADGIYQSLVTFQKARDTFDKTLRSKAAGEMTAGGKMMGEAFREMGQNIIDSVKQ